MRILTIGWFADRRNSGGMEVHIRELCRNLTLEGHFVRLVVPEPARNEMNYEGANMQYIDCKTNAESLHEVIKSVRQYNQKIIAEFRSPQFDFDIIHSHDWLGIKAAKSLSEKFGKPWVHSVHSLEHIRATEETKSEISKIEKQGMLECNKLITVSNLMKNEIAKKYKLTPDKISVINNYAGFGGAQINREQSAYPTILFVGRLAFQKGIEHLILAFGKILREFPSTKLIIAGDGNLDNGLKSLALSLGIEKSILFEGFVDEERLKELYCSATLFVSPSVFEPFGITILDAVNFGVPVVATKNTGCLELFSPESIAVAEPENSGKLAEKIIGLLHNKDKQNRMVESAKRDLEKADDWERIAKKTSGVYAEV